jgi:hypothetical protein
VRAFVIAGLLGLVAGCGDSDQADPVCPDGVYDDNPPVACSVPGQHCRGDENGAYCIGCPGGPHHWETDLIGVVCGDAATADVADLSSHDPDL